jgi:dephospho-CoA kinase
MKIVGICGKIGAGKDTVADHLVRNFDFNKIVMSDVIKEELKKLGREINRVTMQDLGNEYREKYGVDVWSKFCVDYAKKNGWRRVAITGVRTSSEVNFYKNNLGKDFTLLCLKANKEQRYDRMLKRASIKDLKTTEEMESQDARERKLWDLYEKYDEVADYVINNNNSMVELWGLIEEFLNKFNLKPPSY